MDPNQGQKSTLEDGSRGLPKNYVASQSWENSLLSSWPLPPGALRSHVPAPLEIDVCEGSAWVTLAALQTRKTHFRYLPPLPFIASYAQLNLRTYVRYKGAPGVWFLSMDTSSRFSVYLTRLLFHLPFFYAKGEIVGDSGEYTCSFQRAQPGASPGHYIARYRPVGEVYRASHGTLEYWLTERYTMFVRDPLGRFLSARVEHEPWPLMRVEAEIDLNTVAAASGIQLPDVAPHFSFSHGVESRSLLFKSADAAPP